jgi:hypothetical protein
VAPHIKGVVSKLSEKPGEKDGKAYVKYGVCIAHDGGETWCGHFSATVQAKAQELRGKLVLAWIKQDGRWTNLVGIDPA